MAVIIKHSIKKVKYRYVRKRIKYLLLTYNVEMGLTMEDGGHFF